MSKTVAGLTNRRDMADSHLKKGEYKEALEDYTIVVDNLCADSDKLALLKMHCWNSRSLCYIQLEKYEDALKDTLFVVDLFDRMRPKFFEKKPQKKNEPLKRPLHIAYARRGQVCAAQGDVAAALEQWDRAITIWPNGEAQELKDRFLLEYGIPAIDLSDELLKPYSSVFAAIRSEGEVVKVLHEVVMEMNTNRPTDERLRYLDEKGIGQLILGVLNFHMKNESIVDIGLTISGYFVRRGFGKAWLNHEVLGKVMMEYSDNADIMKDVMMFLSEVPKNLFGFFARQEYLDIYLKMFEIEILSDVNISEMFKFLFQILKKGGSLEYMKNTQILRYVFAKKGMFSMLLLAKLSLVPEMARTIRSNEETLPWMTELLGSERMLTKQDELDPLLVLLNNLLSTSLAEGEDEHYRKDLATAIIPLLSPLVKGWAKSNAMLRDLITLTKVCLILNSDAIAESNMIGLLAILTGLMVDKPYFVDTVLDFLLGCVNCGLIEKVKEVKPLVPNLVKIVDSYWKVQAIAEKAVALLVELDHPNKKPYLQNAMRAFPKSELLKKYVNIFDVSAIMKQIMNQ